MPRPKRRVGSSSIGEVVRLRLTSCQWLRMEQALEAQLSPLAREQLVQITEDYLYWLLFEMAAVDAKTVEKRIRSVNDGADILRRAFEALYSGGLKPRRPNMHGCS